MKKIPLLALFLVVQISLSGCDLVDSIHKIQQLKPTPAHSTVLFYDEFNRVLSGWDRTNGETGVTDYEDGHYLIRVDKTNLDLWSNPGKDFTDVSIEVDASKIKGPESNDFGIICRYQSELDFYFGIVSSDNYYAIGKMSGGTQELLTGAELQITDKVKGGSALNHLRFDCSGSTLTLYANGYFLAQVEDPEFLNGDVGLIAGTLGRSRSFHYL